MSALPDRSRKVLCLSLFLGFFLFSHFSHGQATVTGGAGADALCVTSPGLTYADVSNIVISENNNTNFDLPDLTVRTFTIRPTDGAFRFQANTGGVSVTGGGGIFTSISVTTTEVVVSVVGSANAAGFQNTITVSGLKIGATAQAGPSNLRIDFDTFDFIVGIVPGQNITTAVLRSYRPTATVNPASSNICINQNLVISGVPAAGSGTYVSHLWTGNTGPLSSTTIQSPTFNTSVAGTYNLNYFVTDNIGCTNTLAGTTTITVSAGFTVSLASSDADNTICTGESVTFTATPVGHTNPVTYQFFVNGVSVQGPGGPNVYTTSALTNGQSVYAVADDANALNCRPATNIITTTVNPIPADLAVTPASPTVCINQGVDITIASSQVGVNYQLKDLSNNNYSSVFPGTGANLIITSSPLTANTVLKVVATNPTTPLCTRDLTAQSSVTVSNPAAPAVSFNSVYCTGETIVAPLVTSGTTGVRWYNNIGLSSQILPIANPLNPTAAELGFSTAAATTKTVYVTQTVAGCQSLPTPVSLIVNTEPDANAGPDASVCALTTALAAVPSVGTGTWSKISGPGTVSFAPNNNTATANLTVSVHGVYILQWTENNASCSDADDVQITFSQTPSAAAAGTDISQCNNGNFTLNASSPTVGTGAWSVFAGTATITNAALPNTTVTGVPLGTSATLRWTVTNAPCAPTSDDVILTNNINPTPTLVSSDADNTICAGTNVTFTAGGGTNYEFFVDGLSVQNSMSTTYATTALTNGQIVSVKVTNAAGCSVTSSGITNTVNPNPLASIVSNDGDNIICAGSSVTFTATPSGSANYNFRVNNVSEQNSASNIFTTSALVDGDQVDVIITTAAGCTGTSADIIMDVDDAPNAAAAGPDIEQCNNEVFTMDGNVPDPGASGLWTLVSGSATITSAALRNTTVTDMVAGAGDVVLRWTISNGVCTPTSDEMVIRNLAPPTASDAGPDQNICGTSTPLAANTPVVGTGLWSFAPGGTADGLGSINNLSSPTSFFSGTAGQTYTLRWTISNGICAASTNDVQIRFDNLPTTALAGGDQNVCSISAVLGANAPVVGTGLWTITSGGAGSFLATNNPTTTFTGSAGSTYVLRWTISNGVCTSSFDEVQIKLDQTPTVATAGGDQNICGTSATLGGNTAVIGTGLWTIISGGGGSFVASNNPTTTFNGVAGTTYVLRWTISNGACGSTFDEVQIRLDQSPTVANAGPNQNICGSSAVLAGNTPVVGTGLWTITSGAGGSFVAANNPTTTFNGTAGVTYILRWTISNGVCASSFDATQIVLTQSPTVATAGADQNICGSSAVLAGNTAVVGTGLWSIVSGAGGSFVATNNPTTTFNGVAGTTYVLRWTITNGACGSTFDEVQIRLDQSPTVATAGADQNICGTSAVLTGNTAVVGTGIWSIISGGGGSFVANNNPTTTFNGTAGTTYVLRWTISNGVCASTFDEVQIRLDQSPTVATAGGDQNICGTSATLGGNTAVIGTGLWTIISGVGGSFVANNNPTTTFNGAAGTTYVLRWTISNGACASTFDEVQIRLDQTPTVATAGGDQNICGTSANLVGNNPLVGTGLWTIISGGGGSFVDATNETTIFNGLAGTTYVLRWTISNGVCASSFDEVQIRLDQTPTVATAGGDQNICGTSATLGGSNAVIGTGVWTIISGAGGSFVDNTDEGTTFNGIAGNTYVLRWTISNGACASSFDEVQIRLDQAPTVATAGGDQNVCGTSAVLAGNAPVVGTGVWTVFSGAGGSFVAGNNPTTTFNGVAGTTYILRWTISNGVCADSFDEVQVRLDQSPTIATAGGDQNICGTSAVLTGNTAVVGTGLWSIMSGGGGSFVASNNPTTTFNGAAGTTYVLRWTISNGSCAATFDEVQIRLDQTPTTATAGGDQNICGTSTILTGNTALAGTGLWTITSGVGGSFVANNNPTTTFNGAAGSTYILRWTISNGVCASTFDEVQIRFDQTPPVATAGSDQNICGSTATLNGNDATPGIGLWTISSGAGGSFVAANNPITTFNGVAGVTYILRWTISNGACATTFDEVQIRFDQTPTLASAGPDQNICGTSAILAGSNNLIGAGLWTIISGGGGSLVDATDEATTFNGVAGTTYVLRWTISNGVCANSFDEVQIRFDQTPTLATAGGDQTLCANSTTLAGSNAVIGAGLWTIISGAGGSFVDNTDEATAFNGVAGTTYILRWTISNGSCASTFDEVQIRFDSNPTIATAGIDQNVCGANTPLAGNLPVVGTGLWTITSGVGGSFALNSDPTTTFTGSAGTTYVLRWTITNGVCADSFDEVQIKLDEPPTTAEAGLDQNICGTNTTLAGNVPTTGTGMWTVMSGAGGSFVNNANATTSFNGVSGTTYVLRWTISNGSCVSTFDEVQIRFDLTPTSASAGTDQDICGGTSAILNANNPVIGVGTWTVISGAGGSFVDDTDETTTFNGVAGTTYVLRWTIANGICANTFDEVQIALKRIPDVFATSQVICSATSTNIVISNPNAVPGTTFTWVIQSVANVSGGLAGNGNVISQFLTSTDGVTQGIITYRITPTANGCAGTPFDVTATVNPTPVITTAAPDLSETICSEDALNFTPTSTVAGTTYSWTSSVSGSLNNVSPVGIGTIQDVPENTTNANATITYVITPTAAGCAGATVSYVVTVTPKPNVAAANQGICSGQSTSIAITNPNNVAGTTYTWIIQSNTNVSGAAAGSGNNISQVLSSADAVNTGTIVYRITPLANGCPGDPLDVTVTVSPVPVITNTAPDLSKQICSDQALGFLPTSTIAGTTFNWTSTFTGPLSAGSISASGNGMITDTPVNTGNVDGTITYRITPEFNGCFGLPVDLVVSVKPLPSASGSDFTICSGQSAFVTINPTPKSVAGTTFSWTALPSANIIGATNGNGSTISQLLSTSNASVGTVVYTITPFANGCGGPATNIVATVNPVATVSAGADFQVCEPVSIPVSGNIGGSATAGTWSIISGVGALSPSVTGAGAVTTTYSVGGGDIGGSVVLRLTSNDPDGAGPCSIVTDDIIISVNRRARVTVPADYVICEPPTIGLTGDLDPSATAGSWSVLSGSGLLSVSSITGDIVTASYTPSPADVATTVSFRLTTNDPDGTGPCTPAFDDINITINRSSRVNAGPDKAVCQDNILNLDGSISGATTSVNWTGGTGTFAAPTNPTSTYTFSDNDKTGLPKSIIFTLTGNDPDGAGPCTTVSDQVAITVDPLPSLFLFNLKPNYAENYGIETLAGVPAGGTFTGPGILAGTSSFNTANAGYGVITIQYSYTDPTTGCSNSIAQNTIVNPVTQVDFNIEEPSDVDALARLVICENSGTNDLLKLIGIPEWNHSSASTINRPKFESPEPALQARITFDGVNGYRLNTKNLPGGLYTIQYIFTNILEATDTLTKTLVVNSAPRAVINVPNSCIEDVITFNDNSFIINNLSGATIDEWSWTYGEGGNGNDGISQFPTYQYITQGFKTLGLTVTTDQGCQHDTTRVIRVSDPPKPNFTWSKICVETETTEFKDLSDPGIGNIIQYAWDFDDGDVLAFGAPTTPIPPNTHSGKTSNTYKDPYHKYASFQVYNVKLTISTDDGCQNAVTKRVFILDYNTPTPTAGYSENFENGKGTWVETSSHNDPAKAGIYSWVFGPPAGDVINSAFSGTNAWWTGGNANTATDFATYYHNDSTEVTGPCLDLSEIKRPMISLNYWADSQENFDGAVVQYSIDGGATWISIGDAEKRGINWYNSKNLLTRIGGENDFAWTGHTGGWKNARFNLEQIPVADRDLVVLRIAFGSNNDNLPGTVMNGFAFDDIYIGEKKRTVLVEHFTNQSEGGNLGPTYLDNLYRDQTLPGLKTESDFIKLQYHIANPGFDQLNKDNPTDPAARAFTYGLDEPQRTVMDGIIGQSPYIVSNGAAINFNGDHALIDAIEIDRRALDDPAFQIDVAMDMSQSSTSPLQATVTFTYIDSLKDLANPVILHAALVETDVPGAFTAPQQNVLRKLLWQSEGITRNRTWTQGDVFSPDGINYTIDVPIANPNNLYLVVFVQEKTTQGSGYILQSKIVKVPPKLGLTPVGVGDNPFAAEISNIQVYPNPASKYINFSLDNVLTRDYTYRIIDQRGVTILEGDLNHDLTTPQQVELNVLSNGIYFVQIRVSDNTIIYKKIAVMNRH